MPVASLTSLRVFSPPPKKKAQEEVFADKFHPAMRIQHQTSVCTHWCHLGTERRASIPYRGSIYPFQAAAYLPIAQLMIVHIYKNWSISTHKCYVWVLWKAPREWTATVIEKLRELWEPSVLQGPEHILHPPTPRHTIIPLFVCPLGGGGKGELSVR